MTVTVLELIMLTVKFRKYCGKLKFLQKVSLFIWKILHDIILVKGVLLDRKLSCDVACKIRLHNRR